MHSFRVAVTCDAIYMYACIHMTICMLAAYVFRLHVRLSYMLHSLHVFEEEAALCSKMCYLHENGCNFVM